MNYGSFPRLIGCAICLAFLLCSCEKAEVPQLEKDRSYSLCVKISDFDVKYLDVSTRAGAENSRRISFAVLNESGEKVDSVEQVEDSIAVFGRIDCKLKAGRYTLIAVVHSSSEPAGISDSRICFSGDSITDTFLATQEIDLSDDSPVSEINMKASRKVSLFRLTCRDELPDNIKSFRIKVGRGSTMLNPRNGFSVGDKDHIYFVHVSPSDRGCNDYSFDVYTFLPSDQTDADVEVTANSIDGDEIRTVSFTGIRLGINKKTEAQGAFFVQRQSLGIGYDDAWADEETIEY